MMPAHVVPEVRWEDSVFEWWAAEVSSAAAAHLAAAARQIIPTLVVPRDAGAFLPDNRFRSGAACGSCRPSTLPLPLFDAFLLVISNSCSLMVLYDRESAVGPGERIFFPIELAQPLGESAS